MVESQSTSCVIPGFAVAAEVTRLILVRRKRIKSEPPHVGCYGIKNLSWCLLTGGFSLAVAVSAQSESKSTNHWAFKPPVQVSVPASKSESWSRTSTDRFILARLEAKGIRPNSDAESQVFLRRVFFDLIGLPPTLDEINTWTPQLRENTDKALPQLVDQLLAHPGFGARWGKHWLDVARFAESAGQSRNISYRFAWPYRNWVIDALNADMPFDRFILAQIAGDLLPSTSRKQLERQHTATGFLLVGPKLLNENNKSLVYRMGVVDDQIDTTFRAFMGLTVGCARCHDHFYDPVASRDYHALAGIFRSTKNLAGVKSNNNTIDNGLFPLGEGGQAIIDKIAAAEAHLKEVTPIFTKARLAQAGLENDIKDAKAASASAEKIAALEKELEVAKKVHKEKAKIYQDARKSIPEPPPSVMAVKEGDSIADCELFTAGDVGQPGKTVPRGTLSFLLATVPMETISTNQSGRMQLARWIADSRNPLTARVIVNRVWSHLFGRGLVDTPDNFGTIGSTPSHPELLDHLALGFVEKGWSIKTLIRTLMRSRVYRLSSDHDEAAFAMETDNRLLWRMNRRRLEGEMIRDAMLHVANRLDSAPIKGSVVGDIATFEMNPTHLGNLRASHTNGTYRSVYLPVVRAALPDMMKVFDAADPSLVVGQRDVTTVAPQALFLMNNEFVKQQARHAAERLLAIAPACDRIDATFQVLLGRKPSTSERQLLTKTLAAAGGSDPVALWADVCHGLMASGEFRTIY